MDTHNDYSDIKKLLAELPAVTLPESLSAEALFAKMDAAPQVAAPTRTSKVIDITRRLRPVLSYAAVFAVLVLVYYGSGVDQSSTMQAPAAAPDMVSIMEDSADVSSSAAAPVQEFMMAAPPLLGEGADAQNEMAEPPAAAPRSADLPETAVQATDADAIAQKRNATGGQALGGLYYFLDKGEDEVVIHISAADDPQLVTSTIKQQGNLAHMAGLAKDSDKMLIATLSTGDSNPDDITNLHSYPTGDKTHYMILSVISGDPQQPLREIAAVQGSNLLIQPVGDNVFVIFSDSQQQATTVESFQLGGATIELR